MPKNKSYRKRKRKSKIKFSQRVGLRRKNEAPKNTLQRIEGRPPASVAPVLRVKIKKK